MKKIVGGILILLGGIIALSGLVSIGPALKEGTNILIGILLCTAIGAGICYLGYRMFRQKK